MKKLIAGVVLGLGLSMAAHGAGDPEAGEANAGVCAGCHGENGAAPVMGAYPKIAGLGKPTSSSSCRPFVMVSVRYRKCPVCWMT